MAAPNSEAPPPPDLLTYFNAVAPSYALSTGGCTQAIASHILSLHPPTSTSTIHDNAAGPGILTQHLLALFPPPSPAPTIHVTDFSPAMISCARAALAPSQTLHFHSMPGESLDFPDGTFTHSYTNFGLMFFADPVRGAREIHRTLRPAGVALVTTWGVMGYVEPIRAAQRAVRPEGELFDPPMPKEWYQAAHLRDVLKQGGFGAVEVHEKVVCFGGETAEEVAAMLVGLFARVATRGWSEAETQAFGVQLVKEVEKVLIQVERDGKTVVGVPMTALVAVATKEG